ncbi:hypothetical protein V6N13_108111 [Hibiscus sabdariffa]
MFWLAMEFIEPETVELFFFYISKDTHKTIVLLTGNLLKLLHAVSTERTILSPFTKEYRVLAAHSGIRLFLEGSFFGSALKLKFNVLKEASYIREAKRIRVSVIVPSNPVIAPHLQSLEENLTWKDELTSTRTPFDTTSFGLLFLAPFKELVIAVGFSMFFFHDFK